MHESILAFWFEEIDPKMWWVKDADFDARSLGRASTPQEEAFLRQPDSSF